MEPEIYKPSIYNGAGIYKNGTSGGGESWRDWYDELERVGYKISTVEFKNPSLMAKFEIDSRIEAKHIQILGNDISHPYLIYLQSNQGYDDFNPAMIIDGYLSEPKRIRAMYYQCWTGSEAPMYNYEWNIGQTIEYICTRTKNGFGLKINNILFGSNLIANASSSWYAKSIYPLRNGFGSDQMYFYYTKVYDRNNELIMNFIPVKRKVDGLLGVLETLTGLFASDSNLSEG